MYKPVRNQYKKKKKKHQCAMMDQNIFMKQIGSIVLILNHTGFFLGHFLYFRGILEFFHHLWKPWFCSVVKTNFLQNQHFFVNKSWKDRKYICHKQKKTIRQFGQKSLSVFRGLPWENSKHIKHFFGKCFIIFSAAYEKHIFHNFKIWFTTICWFCLAMCFLTIIHFNWV